MTYERNTDQLAARGREPNAGGLAEYAALRNEITERISMVSEQGFSAAIAMFAIFSLFVGLAYSDFDGVPFLLGMAAWRWRPAPLVAHCY